MGEIYFTSDLHFCHDRAFIYEPRGFNNIWDMNAAIVKNWNDTVQPDDDVYVLGDIMLNNDAEGLKLLKSLKGQIHIIIGNHDTDTRIAAYKECYNVVEVCYATVIKYNGYHFYLSHYPTMTANLDTNKPLKARIISLCGHSHYKNKFEDMDKGLIYHCELDAHNCYPVSIEQIIADMNIEVEKCKNML